MYNLLYMNVLWFYRIPNFQGRRAAVVQDRSVAGPQDRSRDQSNEVIRRK
jgi:hypothetical protein